MTFYETSTSRGKYRDVILPMTVLRRLDSILEPRKTDILKMKAMLDLAQLHDQDEALRGAAKQAFLQHLEVHSARSEGPV